MKIAIKFILSFICYVVLIPLLLAATVCLTWYVLPDFRTTIAGKWISAQFPDNSMLMVSGVIIGCILLFFILGKIFRVVKNSKANNLYAHVVSWILALSLAAESLFTLFTTESLISITYFEFTMIRKIGIVAGGVALLLYSILAPKIRRLVDRKIQAYDTAKELNANGRSSIVGVQILKALDFCCPELILMTVLCFAFDFSIALYFIYIIVAFAIPIVGNMICDYRVKREAVRREQEKADAQVNATAEAVADLLEQRGNN